MIVPLALWLTRSDPPQLVSQGLAGYISMQVPAPKPEFMYGVSLYTSAWPLVERPLRDFQIGLASIWILPDNRDTEEPLVPKGTVARDSMPERGPSYRDVFQTIEGGLGFWASTRFGSDTAKFRMNGTANGYNHEISSPGWGFGQTEPLPPDQMGIAQLSPRLLVPPDGLTFRPGTVGDIFGYAWMALPLIDAKPAGADSPVPTGNQSWTLFLNAKNFRGPVAFYVPATWSRISKIHPPATGRGLDAKPGLVTGGAIEINTVPRFLGQDGDGTRYSKIPRLQFPVDKSGRTVLIHNLTHYSKGALFDQVETWRKGGEIPTGAFNLQGANTPPVRANPLSVRQGQVRDEIAGTKNWVTTAAWDQSTFGLLWNVPTTAAWKGGFRKGTFPEYCREKDGHLTAIPAAEVPESTGLAKAEFPSATTHQAYESGADLTDEWHVPGAKSKVFRARLADGSTVSYAWFRFVDQPSLQRAGLSPTEKMRLQALVEQIHRHWTSDKNYLPPPKTGRLASLDTAMFVKPPKGMEVGYVPIVVRQADF